MPLSAINDFLGGLFGRADATSASELLNMSKRNPYSRYLPWLTYNPRTQTHLLTDGTVAYFYELTPLNYAGLKQIEKVASALKQPFPEGTVVQFIMASDDNIDHVLDYYQHQKRRQNEVGEMMIAETRKFMEGGVKGLNKNAGMPVRLFRAFVCVKSDKELGEIMPTFEQMLNSAGLNPQRMDENALIDWVSSSINNQPRPKTQRQQTRDDTQPLHTREKPIRERCVNRDSIFNFKSNPPILAGRYGACLTPTNIPASINPQQVSSMFGGIMGLGHDQVQLNFPFTYSLNIIYEDDKAVLAGKASLTMSQAYASKFSKKIKDRIAEFDYYNNNSEKQIFVKVIPTLWIFGDTKEALNKAVSRTKSVWGNEEAGKWAVAREGVLSQTLFITSQLGGLYHFANNVKTIDRHFYMTLEAAATLAPIQSDFAGNGPPNTLLLGRKGQLAGIDVFAEHSTNSNYFVCAESGGGKSFFLGTLLMDAYMAGEKLRIVDLGGSYKKACRIAGGKYIDFNRRTGAQTINPLDFYAKDEQDFEANIVAAVTVISAMIYSKTMAQIPEHESGLVTDAVRWALKANRAIEGTDAIYEYLRHYQKICGEEDTFVADFVSVTTVMAHNMKAFTSKGAYGTFFVGKSTINIADDDFVVIELDDIKGDPELFNVVVLQMMNEITQDLYLSNRQNRRFILFEEAPTILKDNGVENLSYLAAMVNEGYRRARKYGGSFGVVMQSIMDTLLMGKLGQVLLSNSAYKFMLSTKSGQYAKACKEGVLDHDKFSENILTSLVNNKPHYAEIFIEAPQGRGVGRLVVDPLRYHINSTEAEDIAFFMALTDETLAGLSAKEALMLIWKNQLDALYFQSLTKKGVHEKTAMRHTLRHAQMSEDDIDAIVGKETDISGSPTFAVNG